MKPISSFAALAALIPAASCITVRRKPQAAIPYSLDLFVDDFAADYRMIYAVTLDRAKPTVEARKITGWNPVKQSWMKDGGRASVELPDRKGQKAFLAAVAAMADAAGAKENYYLGVFTASIFGKAVK